MSEEEVLVIEARPASLRGRVRAAWQYRHYYPILFKEITMRKFRNTLLGYWWLILRPLIPVVIGVIIFTLFIEIETGDLPYGMFFLSGYICWHLFQSTLRFMSRTMMWMRSVMKKMYLPKLLIPLASIGVPLVELAVTIVAILVLAGYYYFTLDTFYISTSWQLLLSPVSLALSLIFAMSVGMVVSVIALLMRDIIFSIAYVTQMAMFITPVIYPLSSVPEHLQWLFIAFNPMTGVIETSRWALTGFGSFEPAWLLVSVVQISLIAALCLTFFVRAESYLSDVA